MGGLKPDLRRGDPERYPGGRANPDEFSGFGLSVPVFPRTSAEGSLPIVPGTGEIESYWTSQLYRMTPYLWESVSIPKESSTQL